MRYFTVEPFWSPLSHAFVPVPSLTRERCRWPSICVRAEWAPSMWTPEQGRAPEEGSGQVLCSWMHRSACCIQLTGRQEGGRTLCHVEVSLGSPGSRSPGSRSPGMICVITQETNWYFWGYVQGSWKYCTCKMVFSLLALEQGGTSSPVSQVTWIINSLSRESASLFFFLFSMTDNLEVLVVIWFQLK